VFARAKTGGAAAGALLPAAAAMGIPRAEPHTPVDRGSGQPSSAASSWASSPRTCSAVRVHCGIHQLASPSKRISAGTSRARMRVASRMMPAARPIARGLNS